MVEHRRHIRVPSSALIEMQHPVLGQIEVKARDLSDGGICALMGSLPPPPLGTELMVRIKRYTGTLNRSRSGCVSSIISTAASGSRLSARFHQKPTPSDLFPAS